MIDFNNPAYHTLLAFVLAVSGLFALRLLKPSMLTWLAAWWVGIFLFLTFGFAVPIPVSVIKIYMGIVTLALLAYIFTEDARLEEVTGPLGKFIGEGGIALWLVVLLIPTLAALQVYAKLTKAPTAPNFARTVHPATPDSINVHEKDLNMITLDSPYRHLETDDPDTFAEHVEDGRRVYYQNCFYCHGDLLAGAGMFAHGLNPIPTNFQDPGIIPNFQESFFFWRISKGAPGLPEEGGPWDSAMPAWENFLTEEEMWNVILFMTEFTEYRPRALTEHSGGGGH